MLPPEPNDQWGHQETTQDIEFRDDALRVEE